MKRTKKQETDWERVEKHLQEVIPRLKYDFDREPQILQNSRFKMYERSRYCRLHFLPKTSATRKNCEKELTGKADEISIIIGKLVSKYDLECYFNSENFNGTYEGLIYGNCYFGAKLKNFNKKK